MSANCEKLVATSLWRPKLCPFCVTLCVTLRVTFAVYFGVSRSRRCYRYREPWLDPCQNPCLACAPLLCVWSMSYRPRHSASLPVPCHSIMPGCRLSCGLQFLLRFCQFVYTPSCHHVPFISLLAQVLFLLTCCFPAWLLGFRQKLSAATMKRSAEGYVPMDCDGDVQEEAEKLVSGNGECWFQCPICTTYYCEWHNWKRYTNGYGQQTFCCRNCYWRWSLRQADDKAKGSGGGDGTSGGGSSGGGSSGAGSSGAGGGSSGGGSSGAGRGGVCSDKAPMEVS